MDLPANYGGRRSPRATSRKATGVAQRGEYVQFLCHARGSLCEFETQIFISRNLGYITKEQEQEILSRADELGRILNGLITSIERKKLKTVVLDPNP